MTDGRPLLEALKDTGKRHLLVIGDLMVDQFLWGEVSRISPEAPVPVVEVQQESLLLGGAANVANNLKDLGAKVTLCGLIGKDDIGRIFKSLSEKRGIGCRAVELEGHPTTLKTRVIARGQQVVRVDRENSKGPDSTGQARLLEQVGKVISSVDGVIVSDYAKGVVSEPLMELVVEKAKEIGIPTLIDPKPVNTLLYQDVTVVTPNQKEAEAMAGLVPSNGASLSDMAEQISQKTRAQAVLITRGKQGMLLWQKDKGTLSIPTMAREVFDVTGAGDTVIATLALGVVSGLDLEQAAHLANLAAGIVVGKVGTATVSVQELMNALKGFHG